MFDNGDNVELMNVKDSFVKKNKSETDSDQSRAVITRCGTTT